MEVTYQTPTENQSPQFLGLEGPLGSYAALTLGQYPRLFSRPDGGFAGGSL